MDWHQRLHREALEGAFPGFRLLYHLSVRPAIPEAYDVPGLVAVTFRLRRDGDGRLVFVTSLDPRAAVHLGRRLGLDEAESIAMVDSHERIHVALQLEGVAYEVEEVHSNFVDAVWLSLRYPRAAHRVVTGEFGVVRSIGDGFWEAMVEPVEGEAAPGRASSHGRGA